MYVQFALAAFESNLNRTLETVRKHEKVIKKFYFSWWIIVCAVVQATEFHFSSDIQLSWQLGKTGMTMNFRTFQIRLVLLYYYIQSRANFVLLLFRCKMTMHKMLITMKTSTDSLSLKLKIKKTWKIKKGFIQSVQLGQSLVTFPSAILLSSFLQYNST